MSDLTAAPALIVEKPVTPPMSDRTRHGLGVLGAALGVGVLGDALLRPAPWGLNVALWTLALVGAAVALQRWAKADDDAVRAWAPAAVGVAALMVWRDSPTLKALDLTALLLVLGLAVHRARGGAVRLAGVASYALGLVIGAGEAAGGAGALVGRDVRWAELPRNRWSAAAAGAARGLAIALPLLLVFGALLVAADAAFERLVGRAFAWNPGVALGHVFLSLLFAWVAAGVLRALVLRGTSSLLEPAAKLPRPTLGIVEIGVVLGLLDLLFLAFVAVQLPYFFGAYETLTLPGAPTYAGYARRGFFELVTVAAMALPLLLFAHWLLRRQGGREETVFRVLAGAMVGLLFVMMASGLHRMRLYQLAYGLTELRVYTTAFMLWLAVVLGWLAATVLRGRRERFAYGALLAALETLVVLHAVNPDGLIVRVNAARTDGPVAFDASYAASLSGDAVPALVPALAALPHEERCHAAGRLLRRWSEPRDWRAWSLGGGRATHVVRARAGELREMAKECPAPPPVSVDFDTGY